MKTLFTSFLLLLSCYSFSQDKITMSDANKVFALIFSDPHQAKLELDRLELQSKKQNDSLYSIILNTKGVYYAQLTKMDSALIYFNKSSALVDITTKRYLNTQNNIAIILKKTGQIDKAIKLLKTNLLVANQKKYNTTRATIYGELASCYGTKDLYKEALEHILISIEIWENELPRPEKKIAIEKQKLGNFYFKMGNMEQALKIYNGILPVFQESNDLQNFYSLQVSIANINLELNAPQRAFKSLQNIIPPLKKLDNKELLVYAYDREAKSLEMMEKYPLAKQKYLAAISYGIKFNQIKTVYTLTQAGNLILKLKDTVTLPELKTITETSVFKNLLKLASLEDRMRYYKFQENFAVFVDDKRIAEKNKQKSDSLDVQLKGSYNQYQVRELMVKKELDILEKEKEEVATNLQFTKINFWVTLLIVALLSLFVMLYYRKTSKKERTSKSSIESLVFENENSKQLLQIEQIESKSKNAIIDDYEDKLAYLALEKLGMEKLLQQIVQEISEIPIEERTGTQSNGSTIFWKNILTKFNYIKPAFDNNLTKQFPMLTKGEREYCSFVKLGLSNKEIAYLLNISPDSVITKKYRLLKKINLSKDIDFHQWISKVD